MGSYIMKTYITIMSHTIGISMVVMGLLLIASKLFPAMPQM